MIFATCHILLYLLGLAGVVSAGFNPDSTKNIAVYWGQNSYGQGSGQLSQQRLAYYCQNANIDIKTTANGFQIIPIAFMNGNTPPITNFANAGDKCSVFSGTSVLSCPEIEEDIKTCQNKYGKTIIISLGGATYTQGGWASPAAAQTAAQLVFDMFGPVNTKAGVNRPFGSAVVDGFDFDFEATTNNVATFATYLRDLITKSVAAGSKKLYMSAAPQCVYPDAANDAALKAAAFDFIMIQFYNNWCGTSNFRQGTTAQYAFNFDVWDQWARTVSKNPKVKLLLGIPTSAGASGGYTSGLQLDSAIQWSKRYPSFGGIMMWDVSQLYANSGFHAEVSKYLGSPVPQISVTATVSTSAMTTSTAVMSLSTVIVPTTAVPTTATTVTTTTAVSTRPTQVVGGVPQWGQCGGIGYNGPTQCQAPFTCTYVGDWWYSCK